MLKIISEIINTFKNYKLESISIIAPYLSEKFFDELKKLISTSSRILIVTDVSCPEDILDKIQRLFREQPIEFKFAQCTEEGMVHAKGYFFRFSKEKYVFLWGSANATSAGFGNNAEIYSWYELTETKDDLKLIDYFRKIKECKISTAVEARILRPAGNWSISLPRLYFVDYNDLSFDLWLQRGYLYTERNTPLRFKVKLKLEEEIPSSKDGEIFREQKLIRGSEPKTIDLEYSVISKTEIEKGDWMKKFLNPVFLGKWCSKECGEHIKELKKQELQQYENAHKVHKESQVEDFIVTIKETIDHLKLKESEPTQYFKGGKEGVEKGVYKGVSIEHYQNELSGKLQKNVEDAKENSIPKLIPVPQLYGTPIWSEFVSSIIEGVVQGLENSNGNKLVSCIRRELSLSSSEQKKKSENTQGELFREADKADLLDWLRSEWKNLKPTIVNYYVPSKNVFQTEDVQTGDDKEGLFSRKISNE